MIWGLGLGVKGTSGGGYGFHPGGNPEANLKSVSHRCHPILVAFVWELTKETIELPLGCLQGGHLVHDEVLAEEDELPEAHVLPVLALPLAPRIRHLRPTSL